VHDGDAHAVDDGGRDLGQHRTKFRPVVVAVHREQALRARRDLVADRESRPVAGMDHEIGGLDGLPHGIRQGAGALRHVRVGEHERAGHPVT
jgi:hypothetical protein